MRIFITLVVLSAGFLSLSSYAGQLVVIVNSDNPIAEKSAASEIKEFYMKKKHIAYRCGHC